MALIASSGVPPYFIMTKSPYLQFGGIAQRYYYRGIFLQVFEDLEQKETAFRVYPDKRGEAHKTTSL